MTTITPTPFRRPSARTVGAGRAQNVHNCDYTALANEIKAAGLLKRRPGWYAARCVVLAASLGLGFVLLFALGQTWWQLLVAVYFAVVFTQLPFLGHDGAHRQVFESGKANEWFSRVVANLFVGLGYSWWMNKHSKHHANPNKIGKDGDIAPTFIVFTQQDAAKHTGLRARIM